MATRGAALGARGDSAGERPAAAKVLMPGVAQASALPLVRCQQLRAACRPRGIPTRSSRQSWKSSARWVWNGHRACPCDKGCSCTGASTPGLAAHALPTTTCRHHLTMCAAGRRRALLPKVPAVQAAAGAPLPRVRALRAADGPREPFDGCGRHTRAKAAPPHTSHRAAARSTVPGPTTALGMPTTEPSSYSSYVRAADRLALLPHSTGPATPPGCAHTITAPGHAAAQMSRRRRCTRWASYARTCCTPSRSARSRG